MKCEHCRYEFCWWCLDEFYTEYHYYHTHCPFRWYLLHGIEILLGLATVFKLIDTFEILESLVKYTFQVTISALVGFTMVKLISNLVSRGKKFVKYDKRLKDRLANIVGHQNRRV